MPKNKTIYARYIIEIFEEDINGRSGIGIKDYADISKNIPQAKLYLH